MVLSFCRTVCSEAMPVFEVRKSPAWPLTIFTRLPTVPAIFAMSLTPGTETQVPVWVLLWMLVLLQGTKLM